jgi:hypothetical protein
MQLARLTLSILATLAGFAADTPYATVRSSGQFDADGTVLYSVYVASAGEKLEEVAVGGTVPLGTRFIESVDIPAGVVFEGVRDNVAVWTLKELPANRLIGPFTFRARPDGAAPVAAEPPAAVSYRKPEAGLADYAGKDSPLVPFEPKGAVIFDQRGTLDAAGRNAPVQIGRTGVYLFVPEGAVRTQTTVAVERDVIDNDRLPKTEDPLWWCGLYRVSISPQEQASKPFGFFFPTRRQITPGLPIEVANNDDGSFSKPGEERGIGFNQFGGGFSCGSFPFGGTGCFGTPTLCNFGCAGSGLGFNQFGFGVRVADRTLSTATTAQLTTTFGTPTTPVQAITDGTSNTIIAILIGRR